MKLGSLVHAGNISGVLVHLDRGSAVLFVNGERVRVRRSDVKRGAKTLKTRDWKKEYWERKVLGCR